MASINVELLPRLGCANVVVTGILDLSPKSVSVRASEVEVGGVVFPLPPNIQLLPLSASSFSLAQSAIAFRVVLGGVNEVGNASLLPLPSPVLPRNLNNPRLNIVVGQDIILSCRCGQGLSKTISLGRVLPLPSHNWDSGASDWYCGCSGRPKKTPDIRPQEGDFLYSTSSIVVSSNHLSRPSLPSSAPSLLFCDGCNRELGEVDQDKGSVGLWPHAVFVTHLESTIGVPPLQDVSSPEDLFLALVNTMVSQNPELMPKVMLKGRHLPGLLLWVVDKNLKLLKGSQDKVAEELTVLKILYKDLPKEDSQSSPVVVPDEVVEAGLKLLEESTNNFLESMKSTQGFLIGYINKR